MRQLILGYPSVVGPATVNYRAAHPKLTPLASYEVELQPDETSESRANEAAVAIAQSLSLQGYEVEPSSDNPSFQEVDRRRIAARVADDEIQIGPDSGQTAAQLAKRVAILERRLKRLLEERVR